MLTKLLPYLAQNATFRRLWYPQYHFMFRPRQLKFFMECLDQTAKLDGAVVEIGCAYGVTTTFLKMYLETSGIQKQYVCVDTFAGFTPSDLREEKKVRGQYDKIIEGMFRVNKVDWFKENLESRGVKNVDIIQADINKLDANALPERISFCLLDVDLYVPILAGLNKVYPRLAPGGIIVVDNCAKDKLPFDPAPPEWWTGCRKAYLEFAEQHGMKEELVEGKLGVIRKPFAS